MKAHPSPSRLAELFRCDIDGTLTRRVAAGRGGRFPADEVAGTTQSGGYRSVSVDGRRYLVHRVIFAMLYGEWPLGQIDHIDGNPSNNRLSNLRDVPPAINSQNQRRPRGQTASGHLGVSRSRSRWKAEIKVDGKRHFLGIRDTPVEAYALYIEAKRRLHIGGTI